MNKRLRKEIAEGQKALDKLEKPEGTGGEGLLANAAVQAEDAPANSVAGGGVAGIRPGEVVVHKKPKPSTPEDNTNPESTGRKMLHFKDFLKQ